MSLLSLMSMLTRVLISERVLGISPEMLVWMMEMELSLVRLDMEGGIFPTRLGVFMRVRYKRKGRLNMEGGIGTG